MTLRRDRSIARQLVWWQAAVLVVLVAVATTLAWADARQDARDEAARRVVDTALAVADSPSVRAAFRAADPTTSLQPYAERVRRDTGTDFVVVMTTDGIRYTHPDPANIGKHYLGSISAAQAGHVHVEQYTGTLGPSVRAVVPVRASDSDRRVIGLVSVGIRTTRVSRQVVAALVPIAITAAVVMAVGLLAAWLVGRRLRRLTHGLGEREITRMFEYYDAVLRAVREGLVLLDLRGRVALANDEAMRLLDSDGPLEDRACAALGLGVDVEAAVADGERVFDRQVPLGTRVLVVSVAPAAWQGRRVGSVLTIRDRTELQEALTQLDTVQELAESLRAQNHEHTNRLHTIVSLVELGRSQEAVEFGTRAVRSSQQLADRVIGRVDDPVVAALLLGKTAQAQERGVELEVDAGTVVAAMPVPAADAVTLLGNLIDNAIDAAAGSAERLVRVYLSADEFHLDLTVDDSGPGVDPADRLAVFERGWSTKMSRDGHGIGLALVGQLVRRHAGRIAVTEADLPGARFEVEIGEER